MKTVCVGNRVLRIPVIQAKLCACGKECEQEFFVKLGICARCYYK